jgi:hypothetical protein
LVLGSGEHADGGPTSRHPSFNTSSDFSSFHSDNVSSHSNLDPVSPIRQGLRVCPDESKNARSVENTFSISHYIALQ